MAGCWIAKSDCGTPKLIAALLNVKSKEQTALQESLDVKRYLDTTHGAVTLECDGHREIGQLIVVRMCHEIQVEGAAASSRPGIGPPCSLGGGSCLSVRQTVHSEADRR